MNKEQLLNETLIQILEIVKSTKDFVIEQMPLVVQEFLRWEIFKGAFFGGGILLITLTLLVIGGYKIVKKIKERPHGDYEVVLVIFLAILMLPLFAGLDYVFKGIKAYVAPRVVIIERFSSIGK